MIKRRIGLLAFVSCALLTPAAAHRGHDALSVVTIAADRTLTVSHRFAASDIEPALATIAPRAQPSLDDPDAVVALVQYLGRNFSLSSERGPIKLTPGPVDLGASEVRVIFTGTAPASLRRLTVTSDLLGDVYPRQVNQVSITSGKIVRTVTLSRGDPKTIILR